MNNEIFRAISKIRYLNTNNQFIILEMQDARSILNRELGGINPQFWYDLSDITSQYTIKDLYNRMKDYIPTASDPVRDKEKLRHLFDEAVKMSESGVMTAALFDEVDTCFNLAFTEDYLNSLNVHYLDSKSFDDFYEVWSSKRKEFMI